MESVFERIRELFEMFISETTRTEWVKEVAGRDHLIGGKQTFIVAAPCKPFASLSMTIKCNDLKEVVITLINISDRKSFLKIAARVFGEFDFDDYGDIYKCAKKDCLIAIDFAKGSPNFAEKQPARLMFFRQ